MDDLVEKRILMVGLDLTTVAAVFDSCRRVGASLAYPVVDQVHRGRRVTLCDDCPDDEMALTIDFPKPPKLDRRETPSI